MNQQKILWADDEIDLLKPHLIFLRNKGYDVVTVNNGADALALASQTPFDLIILDENMPGLSGLETLDRIKDSSIKASFGYSDIAANTNRMECSCFHQIISCISSDA